MRLVITTPTAVAATVEGVRHLRAEDPSGAFGILPGHADLLTALTVSVVSWRLDDGPDGGREGHCAVRGGVLTVTGGESISVATREAVVGDDLPALERNVLTRFRHAHEEEREALTAARRLHLAAVRQILAYLRPERRSSGPVQPTRDGMGEPP